MSYRNLLIGAGHSRFKRLEPTHYLPAPAPADFTREWKGELETLDLNPLCTPDVLWNLEIVPWQRAMHQDPDANNAAVLPSGSYDEIHAYEVLEHLGRQGDFRGFFQTFSEVWRLLKPGGFLCATCPSRYSEWLWGDPGHTRAILPATLVFLNQPQYNLQRDKTSMSDYRDRYRADFDIVMTHDNHHTHQFVLQAVKPSRWSL